MKLFGDLRKNSNKFRNANHGTAEIKYTREEWRRKQLILTRKIKLKSGLDSSLQVKKTSITAVYTYHSNNPSTFWSVFSKHK